MILRLLLLLLSLLPPALAHAQPRQNAIRPELVAEGSAIPGNEVELAILMRTQPGWHGYWQNPGDAGLPMAVEWQLPPGFSVGELQYPVPSRMTIANLMNYVYERDYAVLVRLKVPAGATGQVPIRAKARWLACTDKICVPERGEFSLNLPTGGIATADPRFNEWRRALPRPITTPAKYVIEGGKLRVGVPLPADVPVRDPYIFPITPDVVAYEKPQAFSRLNDLLVAEIDIRDWKGDRFEGVLALADGRGLQFRAVPDAVPRGGSPIGGLGTQAIIWAVLGALAGGILLNLMPCVFPILGLKAMHLAKSGGGERAARRDALGYTAGAVIGTGALGLALLALRAGGSAAGWAFQLQDPRTVLLLTLLATAISLNLLRGFELPVLAGEHNPAGSFGTGALAAFVATPCAGPFMGAALGTALLLPAAGSVLVFAALGLGLALPFVAIAFIPPLRDRLPRPGPWMVRLQRILAVPMALTAAAGLWLLWRMGGRDMLIFSVVAGLGLAMLLAIWGRLQRRQRPLGWLAALAGVGLSVAAITQLPQSTASAAQLPLGSAAWSDDRLAEARRRGRPVFVYFTADWCLTCKANEAAAINRDQVRKAFEEANVEVLVGDWTDGDPAITRFLESRGRAGVPLYLWYAPGRAEPEELPQILTPSMLISRARATPR